MQRTIRSLAFAVAALAIATQSASAGQFKKSVFYSTPGLPEAIVTADFDGDTDVDLAVGDFGDFGVRTLLGKGDGSFRKGPSFSIAPYSPVGLAVGDFDGNHKPDLAVVEYFGNANGKLGIFLGNGDGTFRRSAEYEVGFEPLSAAVADFNGDGHQDVAVTNEGVNGKGSVMVFFGNGDGTFQKPSIYNLSAYPYSVAAGDLNGDGHPDLAVAEYQAGVAILLNKGKGKLGKPVIYPVSPATVTNVVIAELNKDSYPDLVVATFQAVGVLLGTGDGKFGKAALYSTKFIIDNENPYAVVVADFNLDGNPDIATVLEGGNSALFYAKGNGKFGKGIAIKLRNGGGEGITSGDFDHDQAPDLAIVESLGYVAVRLNSQ